MIYMLGGSASFSEELVGSFKKNLCDANRIVFIPTSPENVEKSLKYMKLIMKDFLDIGIVFKECNLLIESCSIDTIEEKISNADIVFLMGGNPLTQMDFIKRKNIDRSLKNYSRTLIGLSAGAINISEYAIIIQDESVNESTVYKGLNLASGISVDVHYTTEKDLDIKDVQSRWGINTIYAIPEESSVFINNGTIKYIGKQSIKKFTR